MNPFFTLVIFVLLEICWSRNIVNEDGTISAQIVTANDIEESFEEIKLLQNSNDVEVYLVESRVQSFKYVLKKFSSKISFLFRQEVQAHSKIPDSPYFPKYYGSFVSLDANGDKIGYLVMEFVDAKDLMFAMAGAQENPKLQSCDYKFFRWMKFIGAELATAIQILHDNNIVHCDIKPENIIIDRTGHLKLIDFGFSVKLAKLDQRMKILIGTEGYIAPEMYSRDYDYKVDWYSYGVTLSFLVGQYLGEGEEFFHLREQILGTISKVLNIDEHALIEYCTRPKPSERIASLSQIQKLEIFADIDWDEMRERIASPPGNLFFLLLLDNLVECIGIVNDEHSNTDQSAELCDEQNLPLPR